MTGLTIKVPHKWPFYTLFSLLMLLLFFRYALLISFPSVVFVGILAMMAFWGDREEILAVCICCVPLDAAVPFYCVLLFCIAVYAFKYGRNVRLDFGFIPIVLIILWELLHGFMGEMDLILMITLTIPYLLFVILFFIRDVKSVDYSFIVRTFSVMVLWICVILVVRLMILCDFQLDVAFFNMQRLGISDEEIGNLVINPNTLGVQCVLAVSCLLQLRINGQKNIGDLILIISILILGALTISRTYLACLLIMIVYLLIISKGGFKQKLKLLFGIIILLTISVFLMYSFFPTTMELFSQRLNIEDITSGRDSLFSVYNNYIISSAKTLFWGLGALNLGDKVTNIYSIAENVPHNGIQEILVSWGIPGLLLVISMMFVMIRRSRQENPNQTMLNYLPFVILLAKIQVGQMVTSPYTMMAFALIYLSLCRNFGSTERSNQIIS